MGCFLEQSKNVTAAVNISDFLPAVKATHHHGDDRALSFSYFSHDSHMTHVRHGLRGAFDLM